MIARVLAAPALSFTSAPANTIRLKARRRRSPGREGREVSIRRGPRRVGDQAAAA